MRAISAEIARILRNVADRIDAREGLGLQRWHIADANGNTVGSFGYSETATEESE
jgi:hypothetical protein